MTNWSILGIVFNVAKFVKHFTVWPTWLANRHYRGHAFPGPPILLYTIIKYSAIKHALRLWIINIFSLNANRSKKTFPKINRLSISRELFISSKSSGVKFFGI